MTRLLVSVRDGREALEAIAGGADLLDVKEPAAGSLGRAGLEATLEVASVVGRVSRPVEWTIACGELAEDGARAAAAHVRSVIESIPDGGRPPSLAKVGLAATASLDWEDRLLELERNLPDGVAQACVVYADWQRCGAPDPSRIVPFAGRLAGRTILVDTFDKRAGGLFEVISAEVLAALVAVARSHGLRVALAGKLGLADAAAIAAIAPDIVAVRSVACGGDRLRGVEAPLVEAARWAFRQGRISSTPEPAS